MVTSLIWRRREWDDDGDIDQYYEKDNKSCEPVTIAETLHWVVHGAKSAHSKPDILTTSANVSANNKDNTNTNQKRKFTSKKHELISLNWVVEY